MQVKHYTIPSARSKAQIKRNILNTLEKHEDSDDTWLNDMHSGSMTAVSQTHEHTVCYEDLPTMPLAVLKPAFVQQVSAIVAEEMLPDDDKTIKFTKPKKATNDNPLDALLRDETISTITALAPQRIYIERNGVIQPTAVCFSDQQHMLRVIEQLLHTAGHAMPAQSPLSDVRLPDGSFLTVALPPSAPNGPALILRKHEKNVPTLHDLVKQGSMSQAMADVLQVCVQARLNIIVCGHVGSGRTTLLNALCSVIPTYEQIVTIEDVVELRLSQPQVVTLQAHSVNTDRAKHMVAGDLVTYAERIHANRLIVGECRSNEAAALLQAMYNGLDGVMTTMFAHDVRDCLARFETLCLLGNKDHSSAIPKLIKTQIAQSINVVVSISPEHKVTNIAEVQPTDEGILKIQSLFHYQDGSTFAAKNTKGSFEASGFYPTFMERCKAMAISTSHDVFKV
jgi:pilus assembly protein CpaF